MNDPAAAYGLGGRPFWFVIIALVVIVLARSHMTYWVGRAASVGAGRLAATGRGPRWWTATRARAAAWGSTVPAKRAAAAVHRWGPLAVTFAYLTVGAQTAVLVAAGVARMPYLRFTLASIPGAIAWAFIWGTVGLGAVWAAAALAAESPWGLAAAGVLIAAALAWWARRRRASRRARHEGVERTHDTVATGAHPGA
ncbi:DedA family protein [Cellulomonas timonensis]|uniref:DedA family protein n=1 Tax=Cellulomonas timonensis TaxID=1689271 RepID=UPI00082D871F|nr:VTT domain-containing protein [Cellulomonas timonensis]